MNSANVIEVIGKSKKGFDDAIANAVKDTCKSKDVVGIDVINLTANVKKGKIIEYKSCIKMACC
ncbi:dodecin domain-containing protein [Candidatus Woesearchaeota archaeon]|nr:dodecin domain-containing protein [Candidatus Woesearchaeota archaeon]